jgi:hypothetical protein
MHPDLTRNLAVAHAALSHRQNIGAELIFIGITKLAFS